MALKFGTKVKAFPLDGTGPKLGHFIGYVPDSEEKKVKIQVGSTVHSLTLRAKKDWGDAGPNGTFHEIAQ